MEECVTEGSPAAGEGDEQQENVKEADSAVNFQRFVYQLFEKNGVLNDLRAYLRGHIVDVLKSAQTGEPPTCQKNFKQRLELNYQALNMLIAEYLLRLDFSYSLSVFVSEIPLANMVFDFAKKLMLTTGDFEDLSFKEDDVWSILNYLGIKCDSEHASQVVEMYNSKGHLPLLMCILKCVPLYHQETCSEEKVNSTSESLSSSARTINIEEKHFKSARKVCSAHDKCKHYVFCKTCQTRVNSLREKYRAKKKHMVKKIKSCDVKPLKVESFMRNIDQMERSLIDEMLQQLKGVYEAEMEMMKQEEEKKIKRSLASHALLLQRQRDEMEESFKAREAELERSVQDKKKFLWGLARALRDQHATMARAMHAVRAETERLSAKEDSLKSQLLQAEEALRRRGEEMRMQISSELEILEGHLESMKQQRESINKERAELESLKTCCNSSTIKVHDLSNEELKSHYDLIKNELGLLKKYLETSKLQPKCVIERSTLTELSDVSSKIQVVLNNGPDADRAPAADGEERRTPNKVVNDLKKQKNVNFRASNVDELYRECGRVRSRSSSDYDVERDRDLLDHLRDENERLKAFARQQREHIDELTSHQARLQAELTASRPRTAPAQVPNPPHGSLNTSVSMNSVGWQKGAGEETSVFGNAQPRILLPGDTLPFIGVLRDRHSDNRRYLINQWRALRRRTSPLSGRGARGPPGASDRPGPAVPATFISPSLNVNDGEESPQPHLNQTFTFPAVPRERPKTVSQRVTHEVKESFNQRSRDNSPMSVLRDAKETLKNAPGTSEGGGRGGRSSPRRERSCSSVLREARLRLRKLEIEAEAVQHSYLAFRRRQRRAHVPGPPGPPGPPGAADDVLATIDIQRSQLQHRIQENCRAEVPRFSVTPELATTKHDFDKYLREYQSNLDAAAERFKTPNHLNKIKPIPKAYSKIEAEDEAQDRSNYLETPLTEFRKLYTQKPVVPSVPVHLPRTESSVRIATPRETPDSGGESTYSRGKSIRSECKENELEILKDNISKMYDLQDPVKIENKIEETIVKSESPQNLMLAVENLSESSSLKVTESRRDLLVVVESSNESQDIEVPQRDQISTQMTIIVSPKLSSPNRANIETPNRERSVSPEQAARLTRNDALNAIFHADTSKRQSSVEMELNISKDLIEDSLSEYEKGGEGYPDDFSADVDNYNSRSDNEHSPVSLPKTSDHDNFWDT